VSATQLKYQTSWKQLPLVATLDLSPKEKEQSGKQIYKIELKDIPDYRAEQLKN
jgi:hypothetical protein